MNVAKNNKKLIAKRKKFGKVLKRLREAKGLTRYRLSLATELTTTQITRYEEGENAIGVDRLMLILDELTDGKWSPLDIIL